METRELFPFGHPAGPDDVVDREPFLLTLDRWLREGHSVVLAGPRRIGKSTVAEEALRRLHREAVYTARVDLFYTASLEELSTRLLTSILQNRTGVIPRTLSAGRQLREWLSSVSIHARVHDLDLGLVVSPPEESPLALLESVLRAAERMAAADDRRLVILWDEFQDIGALPVPLKRLRAILQELPHVAHIFCGSRASLIRTMFSGHHEPFYRFATPLALPDIDRAAWDAYLVRRLGEAGCVIRPAALDLLHRTTGGHPYGVMAVVYHAYVRAKEAQTHDITADDLLLAHEETLDHLDSYYAALWGDVRGVAHAARVLTRVMSGEPPYGAGLPRAGVARSLQKLVDLGVLDRTGRGRYRLVEPLFGAWLERRQQRV